LVVHQIAYRKEDAHQLLAVFSGIADRTIVISSGDVYRSYGVFLGIEEGPLGATASAEDAPLRQVLFPYRSLSQGAGDFLYSYDKIPVEHIVRNDPSLPATVLRLPMVYGPGDRQHRMAAYLKQMSASAGAITLNENLACWRTTRGYVDDVAAAIALAVTDERSAGRIYNVGENEAFSEADWVRKIGNALGWRGQITIAQDAALPTPGNYRQHLVTDSSRIRCELGYREPTAPDEAILRTVRWELEQSG
jgi:nucleoside-diphosphate-sugar epimerase